MMKRKETSQLLIQLLLLTTISGCGWIGIEKLQIQDTISDASTGTDSTSPSRDAGDTDSPADTDTPSSPLADTDTTPQLADAGDSDTLTDSDREDTAGDSSMETDSASLPPDTDDTDFFSDSDTRDTETGTDASQIDSDQVTDTGTDTTRDTDTAQDTGTVSTDSDSIVDTGTVSSCPALPDGVELLGEADAENFSNYGILTSVSFESVSGQSFTGAWHIENGYYSDHSASGQLYHMITEDIATGDHLVLEFWSRCVSSTTGECRTGAVVEKSSTPWTNGVEYYTSVGSDWTFYQVPFVAPVDFVADDIQIAFRIGYADQTIKIFPARLVNYGRIDTDDRPECLPDTTDIHSSLSFGKLPPSTASVDLEYTYNVEVNGKPTPTIAVSNLPSWLSFNSVYNRIFGVPTYSDIGSTPTITIQAENSNGDISHQFHIDVVVDPALLGHWPMDETDGAVAADASGNGRDGAISGDPSWQPSDGRVGGALYCDSYSGDLDYVTLPNDTEMDSVQDDAYTLSAWVRVESVPPGTGNDAAYGILLKAGRHTGLWYNNTEQFFGSHHFDGRLYELSSETISPGTFHHLAAVLEPTGLGYMLLLDGQWIGWTTLSGEDPLYDYGTTPWRIGLAVPDAQEYGWYGDLSVDDVRIYNRALTLHEIQALANPD